MKYTTNLNLKKPDLNDYVNIGDLNDNADIVDDTLGSHVDLAATILQAGHVQLSSAVTSTDETKAATPNAVKKAYDRAEQAFTSASNGKALIGTAITGVDGNVTVPTNPTFQQLADAIGSISTGKKWASGKGITGYSFNHEKYRYKDGTETSGTWGSLVVNGLNFKANALIAWNIDSGLYSFTILFPQPIAGSGRIIIGEYATNGKSANVPTHNILLDTPAYINDSGFRLPTRYGNKEYYWHCYE